MRKPVASNCVTIDGKRVHTITTRTNTEVWGSKFAVPILRVLFRQGHSSQYVANYLLSRYGQSIKDLNFRSFQYQISHHKRNSTTQEDIWKNYLLIKAGRLDSRGKYKSGETTQSYDREVKASIKSLRRLDPEVVERSSVKLPPGWQLKHVFGKKGVYQAWCPPYAEHQEALMREYIEV